MDNITYETGITGIGNFKQKYETLKEAQEEVLRLNHKIPLQIESIYIDEYKDGDPTGTWYRYDRETGEFIKNV